MNPFPLNISEKVNSPELLAWLQQFGEQHYLSAEEINYIVTALGFLYENTSLNSNTEIIARGLIARVNNQFTFSIGFKWKIQGTVYQNTSQFNYTPPNATAGKYRIDGAFLNTSNQIVFFQGQESDEITSPPATPNNMIPLTTWIIYGDVVSDNTPIITGSDFIKKTDYSEVNVLGSGSILLELDSPYRFFRITSGAINVIEGTTLTDSFISQHLLPSNHPLIIINDTATSKTIKHTTGDFGFRLPGNTDFVLPPRTRIEFALLKTPEATYWQFHCVGLLPGSSSSQNLQSVLQQGRTATFTDALNNITFETAYGDMGTFYEMTRFYQEVAGYVYENSRQLYGLATGFYQASKTNLLTGNEELARVGVRGWDDEFKLEIFRQKGNTIVRLQLPEPTESELESEITFRQVALEGKHYAAFEPQMISQNGDYTLANTTALQKIFNGGSSGNGSFTVENGKRYELRLWATFKDLQAVSKNMFFGLLGVTVNNINGLSNAVISSATPFTSNLNEVTSTNVQVSSPSAATLARMQIILEFQAAASGVVIPAVSFSSANANMKTNARSWAKLYELLPASMNHTERVI